MIGELFTLLMIAIGLSMDAFAVSVTNGLCYNKADKKHALYIALTFGIFQGLMAVIGYYLGSTVSSKISDIGHFVAFIILSAIGVKMIFEAVKENDKKNCKTIIEFKELMIQGVATSIDSLAVGLGFSVLSINIWYSSSIIGIVTFIICFAGVLLGKKFGCYLKKKAVITGGIILILIGIKILLENIIVF